MAKTDVTPNKNNTNIHKDIGNCKSLAIMLICVIVMTSMSMTREMSAL